MVLKKLYKDCKKVLRVTLGDEVKFIGIRSRSFRSLLFEEKIAFLTFYYQINTIYHKKIEFNHLVELVVC